MRNTKGRIESGEVEEVEEIYGKKNTKGKKKGVRSK